MIPVEIEIEGEAIPDVLHPMTRGDLDLPSECRECGCRLDPDDESLQSFWRDFSDDGADYCDACQPNSERELASSAAMDAEDLCEELRITKPLPMYVGELDHEFLNRCRHGYTNYEELIGSLGVTVHGPARS